MFQRLAGGCRLRFLEPGETGAIDGPMALLDLLGKGLRGREQRRAWPWPCRAVPRPCRRRRWRRSGSSSPPRQVLLAGKGLSLSLALSRFRSFLGRTLTPEGFGVGFQLGLTGGSADGQAQAFLPRTGAGAGRVGRLQEGRWSRPHDGAGWPPWAWRPSSFSSLPKRRPRHRQGGAAPWRHSRDRSLGASTSFRPAVAGSAANLEGAGPGAASARDGKSTRRRDRCGLFLGGRPTARRRGRVRLRDGGDATRRAASLDISSISDSM